MEMILTSCCTNLLRCKPYFKTLVCWLNWELVSHCPTI